MAGEIMRLSQNRPPLGNAMAYGSPAYRDALVLARRYAGQARPSLGRTAVLTGTTLDHDEPNRLLDLVRRRD
jgi:hypothetical protein